MHQSILLLMHFYKCNFFSKFQLLTRFMQPANMSEDELCKKCETIVEHMKPSHRAIDNLEKMTRGQSQSPLWQRHREGRITATVAHDVKNRHDTTSPLSLINKIMKYNQVDLSRKPAVEFGLNHEQEARELYATNMDTLHKDFSVRESGLVIDKEFPLFGATPDGVRNCTCHGTGLLEIKSSYKYQDKTVSEIVDLDTDNSLCLEKGTLQLKKSHRYFSQIQFQMHVCNLTFCDLVLYTLKGIHVQTIECDKTFTEEMVKKCTGFAVDHIIPELLSPSIAEKNKEMCHCKRPKFGKIIRCSNAKCPVQDFHYECVNIKRKPRNAWTCESCSAGLQNK